MVSISPKSQSWSIDVTLGVIVFMAAFFIFYAVINSNPNAKVNGLKDDASSVISQIGSQDSQLGIVDSNEINESRLGSLKNLTYSELKRRFRTEGDFCIYFEDEKGNIILINNSYMGIGAPSINLSNTPCSQK